MDKFLIFEFLMLVKEVAKLVSQLANPTKKKRTPQKNHKNRLVLHVLFFKLVGQGPCGRVQKKSAQKPRLPELDNPGRIG